MNVDKVCGSEELALVNMKSMACRLENPEVSCVAELTALMQRHCGQTDFCQF